MPSGADDGNALLDMAAVLDFIDHRDGIIRIADDALALAVQRELLTSEDVLARALAVRLEIASRADVRPVHVVAFAELRERFAHRRRKRQELRREVRRILDLRRMRAVEIERACAADNQEAGLGACEECVLLFCVEVIYLMY